MTDPRAEERRDADQTNYADLDMAVADDVAVRPLSELRDDLYERSPGSRDRVADKVAEREVEAE